MQFLGVRKKGRIHTSGACTRRKHRMDLGGAEGIAQSITTVLTNRNKRRQTARKASKRMSDGITNTNTNTNESMNESMTPAKSKKTRGPTIARWQIVQLDGGVVTIMPEKYTSPEAALRAIEKEHIKNTAYIARAIETKVEMKARLI